MEDGREIFDDDLDAQSIDEAAKKSKSKRGLIKNPTTSKGTIQTMFAKMPNKKKVEKVTTRIIPRGQKFKKSLGVVGEVIEP